MTSAATNRWTVFGSVGLLLAFAAIAAVLVKKPRSDPERRTSSFFTDDSGARALFLTLGRVLGPVHQFRRPMTQLPAFGDPAGPTRLLVAGPTRPLDRAEAAALEQWVGAGGLLILLTSDGWLLETPVGAVPRSQTPSKAASTNTAARGPTPPAPSFLRRLGVQLTRKESAAAVVPAEGRTVQTAKSPIRSRPVEAGGTEPETRYAFRGDPEWVGPVRPLLRVEDSPAAVELPLGSGRIIVVADREFASNAYLRRSDNALWLVRRFEEGRPGALWIDEYHHGFGEPKTGLQLARSFLATPFGWAALQAGLAGLCVMWRRGRRMGRLDAAPTPPVASALDILDARAGLFHSADATDLAADLILGERRAALGTEKRVGAQPRSPEHAPDWDAWRRACADRSRHAASALVLLARSTSARRDLPLDPSPTAVPAQHPNTP